LRGDTDMLRALLNAGTNDPEAKTQALERAASGGKLEAMRMLIRYGANPIAPNVLIDAAASGIPAVVKELLQYKPNINGRNKDNATALLSCLHASHYKDQGVNKKQVVQILLEAGADPNLADNKGETPLIVNARDTEIADMLISHGADVNAQADDGFTALINADTPELTHLLLQHGANPFAKTKQGQTALDWARQMGHKERAALLEAAMAGEKP
jgi:ankyrin repeat protein